MERNLNQSWTASRTTVRYANRLSKVEERSTSPWIRYYGSKGTDGSSLGPNVSWHGLHLQNQRLGLTIAIAVQVPTAGKVVAYQRFVRQWCCSRTAPVTITNRASVITPSKLSCL